MKSWKKSSTATLLFLAVSSTFGLVSCSGGAPGTETSQTQSAVLITQDNYKEIAAAAYVAIFDESNDDDVSGSAAKIAAARSANSRTVSRSARIYNEPLLASADAGTEYDCELSGTFTLIGDAFAEATTIYTDCKMTGYLFNNLGESVIDAVLTINGITNSLFTVTGDDATELVETVSVSFEDYIEERKVFNDGPTPDAIPTLDSIFTETLSGSYTSTSTYYNEDFAPVYLDGGVRYKRSGEGIYDSRNTEMQVVSSYLYNGGSVNRTRIVTNLYVEYEDYGFLGDANFSRTDYFGTLYDSDIGGSVDFETIITEVSYDNNIFPYSGKLLITGKNGSTVTLLFVSDQVSVSVDYEGDGVDDDSFTEYQNRMGDIYKEAAK